MGRRRRRSPGRTAAWWWAAASPACWPPGNSPRPATRSRSWRPRRLGRLRGQPHGGRSHAGQRRRILRHAVRRRRRPCRRAWPGRQHRRAPPRRRVGAAAGRPARTSQDRRPGHPRQPLGPGSPAHPWFPGLPAGLPGPVPARSVGAGRRHQRVRAGPGPDGPRVLERLVAPVVGGVHSADPGLLDVDMVAPGLRAGLRGTVPSLPRSPPARGRPAAPARPPPAARPAGLPRPVPQSPASTAACTPSWPHWCDLRDRASPCCANTAADSVSRTPEGWLVTAGGPFRAALLVVAVDGPAAVGLLENAVPALPASSPRPDPTSNWSPWWWTNRTWTAGPAARACWWRRNAGHRGQGTDPCHRKWDWLAAAAGPGPTCCACPTAGRRRRAAQPAGPETDETSWQPPCATLRPAGSQSGGDVVGWDVVRWRGALPFAAVGHKARVADIRQPAPPPAAWPSWVAGWPATASPQSLPTHGSRSQPPRLTIGAGQPVWRVRQYNARPWARVTDFHSARPAARVDDHGLQQVQACTVPDRYPWGTPTGRGSRCLRSGTGPYYGRARVPG